MQSLGAKLSPPDRLTILWLAVLIAIAAASPPVLVGPIVAVANPRRWDGVLAAADDRFLGSLTLAWRHALGRPAWLTDVASLAYASFYFVPLAIAIALSTVSITFLVLGARSFPRWRIPLMAVVAGILFSTAYLSLHHVTDLVAGALVAAVVPATATLFERVVSRDVHLLHPTRVLSKGGST
jgi:membrane-associated phospholipid phosphatase